MKSRLSVVIVSLTLLGSAWASEEAPAVAEAAPAAPVIEAATGPAAPAVVAADREETVDLVGTIDSRDKGGDHVIRVFVDSTTGKRMVLPSHPRQLPTDFTWGTYSGQVTIKAVMLYRVKDGKAQTIIKRLLALSEVAPAAPAAVPAPAETPAAPEATPAPEAVPAP